MSALSETMQCELACRMLECEVALILENHLPVFTSVGPSCLWTLDEATPSKQDTNYVLHDGLSERTVQYSKTCRSLVALCVLKALKQDRTEADMSCATPNTREMRREERRKPRIKSVKTCCSWSCTVLSIMNSRIRSSSYSLCTRALAVPCKWHTSNGFTTERIPNQLGFSIGDSGPIAQFEFEPK